jgi:hypothetical protein
MSVVGRTYLERGKPVVVITQWHGKGCPKNVAIRRQDGQIVVRPFRGLRKPDAADSRPVRHPTGDL